MPTDIERTEAELLADLLDGRLDAADVPPELADLLDLVELADAVRTHVTPVVPTEAFRAALREQVVGAAAPGAAGAGSGLVAGGTAAGSGGVSSVVAGLAAIAVLATSTVSVADRAGPGDLLAGLDRGLESVQLALAGDAGDVDLLVDFAAERVLEAIDLDDVATVLELLATAEDLVDRALALATDQGRDLAGLLDPYTNALLTLATRTDDPTVLAAVDDLLRRAGARPATVVDRSVDVDADDARDAVDGSGPTAGIDPVTPDGDAATGPDAPDDVTDTVGEAVDDVQDTVEDVVDEVQDTVDDAVDDVTDTVGDVVEDVEDAVGQVTDEVGATVDDLVDPTPTTPTVEQAPLP